MYINCTDSSNAEVKSDMSVPVVKLDNLGKKICGLNSSLEFTLESQNGKNSVIIKTVNYHSLLLESWKIIIPLVKKSSYNQMIL